MSTTPSSPWKASFVATLFIELTSKAQMEEWLPKLMAIERSVEIHICGQGTDAREVIRCTPDPNHAAQLTRDEITASVHYVRFSLGPDQVERFAERSVVLAVEHPAYGAETELTEPTRSSLLADLRGSSG